MIRKALHKPRHGMVFMIETSSSKCDDKAYRLKEQSFLVYPCTAEDIGRNGKYKAKQELLVLRQSDSRKQSLPQTMRW